MKYITTKISNFILFSIICVGVVSCVDNNSKGYKADSSGNLNQVNVIISNDAWQDSIGESVRSIFAADV